MRYHESIEGDVQSAAVAQKVTGARDLAVCNIGQQAEAMVGDMMKRPAAPNVTSNSAQCPVERPMAMHTVQAIAKEKDQLALTNGDKDEDEKTTIRQDAEVMKRPAGRKLDEEAVQEHGKQVEEDNNACNTALLYVLSRLRRRQLTVLQWVPKLNSCVVTYDRDNSLNDIHKADLAAKTTQYEGLINKLMQQV